MDCSVRNRRRRIEVRNICYRSCFDPPWRTQPERLRCYFHTSWCPVQLGMADSFENSLFNPLPPTLGGIWNRDGGHSHAPAKGTLPLWNPHFHPSWCSDANGAWKILLKTYLSALWPHFCWNCSDRACPCLVRDTRKGCLHTVVSILGKLPIVWSLFVLCVFHMHTGHEEFFPIPAHKCYSSASLTFIINGGGGRGKSIMTV